MNDLKEKTILITGATGLIGQAVIKELLKTNNHIKIIALHPAAGQCREGGSH